MSAPTIHSTAPAFTVDLLFNAAFSIRRDPRSTEYMDGARAALAFRVEGERIGAPHLVGTAAADAFFAGVAEGHAIWRSAYGAEPVAGADTARKRQLLDIEGNAVDIGAQVEHIDILLQSVFEKLDDLDEDASTASALAAINCYVTCALRSSMLISEAKDHIIVLATEGGAA